MIPSITSLLSSLAGKIGVGLVVATTSVGAAAAAGAEVPFVSSPTDEIVAPATEDETTEDTTDDWTEESTEETTEDWIEGTTEESTEETAEDVTTEEETTEETTEDAATEEETTEETDVLNHGAVVSGFVASTELEGCEKGQATAAVARGDIEPNEDGTIDPALVDAYLADLGRCLDDETEDETTEDESTEDESTDEADETDETDDDSAQERGRPDHAGQRGAEQRSSRGQSPRD